MFKNLYLKVLLALFLMPISSWAEAVKGKEEAHAAPENLMIFVGFGILMIIIIYIIILCFSIIIHLYAINNKKDASISAFDYAWNSINESYISGKHLDENSEGGVRDGHVYDGIQELDNFMPPWLSSIMLGSVVFAAFYLMNIFVWGGIDYQKEEFEKENVRADKEVAEYLAKAANSIDEKSVKQITDKSLLAEGAKIYASNCQTCHGENAEGKAGPNLKDATWIHGGSVNEIFKTIKYGVKQKGMPTWQEKLRPVEIQNVTSYILSLKNN